MHKHDASLISTISLTLNFHMEKAIGDSISQLSPGTEHPERPCKSAYHYAGTKRVTFAPSLLQLSLDPMGRSKSLSVWCGIPYSGKILAFNLRTLSVQILKDTSFQHNEVNMCV